jgi:translocation and assembly module TamB
VKNFLRKLLHFLFHPRVHWSIHTLRGFLTFVLLIILSIVGLFFWLSSSAFEQLARRRLIAQIEEATGGRVELAEFHWKPLSLNAEMDDLIIHGSEAATEDPYVRIDHLHADFTIFGLFTPRIHLRDLDIEKPSIHLLLNLDGSTNIPTPRRTHDADKTSLDEIFNLAIGHVLINNGIFRINSAQHRFSLDAHDLDAALTYQPRTIFATESYHLETTLNNLELLHALNLNYTPRAPGTPEDHYRVHMILDLERNSAALRTLEIVSNSRRITATGTLVNFDKPEWKAKVSGELDLPLLQPLTGFQDAPTGFARVNITAQGKGAEFKVDGPVHFENASYTGAGLHATGFNLDARAHADSSVLRVEDINLHFSDGSSITGGLLLRHWLAPDPGTPGYNVIPAGLQTPDMRPWDVFIPVDGNVNAEFHGLTMDHLMSIVADPAFHHLGLDAYLNGPATAQWTGGDIRTLQIGARFAMSPTGAALPGEAPTTGLIDGTYYQSNSSVDLRTFEVNMPSSYLLARGKLGAFPLTSPTALNIDFHTTDFYEFDTILKDLQFERYHVKGAAALPIQLHGLFNYKGTWGGSLLDPHMTGNANATNISIELPPSPSNKDPNAKPQWLPWDSIDATGLYSAAHIQLEHARLVHPSRTVELSGSIDAAPASIIPRLLPTPFFDSNSTVHLHTVAHGIDLASIYSLAGRSYPVTGTVATEFDLSGPFNNIDGTGWVQLTSATILGEPVNRLHIHGKLHASTLDISSLILNAPAGSISAHGTYDLASTRYNLDAHGSGIELTRIKALGSLTNHLSGELSFSATGAGSLQDPHFELHSSVDHLLLSPDFSAATLARIQTPGALIITATAADHKLTYDLQATLDTAGITGHGVTSISPDYQTDATVSLAHFNLPTLLRFFHMEQLKASSSINGVFNISGPLARPAELHGDADLNDFTATIQGVHLRSDRKIHATLLQERIILDPVHITGEDTDLNAAGNLSITGDHSLNFNSNGSINLKLAETLDSDLTASGVTSFKIAARGTLDHPTLSGTIDVVNGALSLEDLPNGLSQLHGTLEFNQNRLEVRSLTAMTGGGQLSLTGYLAYQNGLYADLAVTGKSIRIRYPQGVSAQGDTTLRLQGPANNLLLSGNLLINHFSLNPDLDIAALASEAGGVRPIPPLDAPSNHVRLDIRLQSAPQLSFQNAYAKLAGNVDLRLQGTLANPSLLGRITVTEGSATLAGTHYELEHGEILFDNPIRIQPIINLNATAHVQDYDITLGIHGTFDRNALTYRSEPPLPQGDVLALLALGHTQEQQRLYTQQQVAAAGSSTDALLNGAINATVSNRVQKLFGAGTVKVDPNYLGAQGTSTSRVTVQEQIGRAFTLTFATNANSTSQQLIQADIAINRHVSLLIARDESGVFSMVIKATRRHR